MEKKHVFQNLFCVVSEIIILILVLQKKLIIKKEYYYLLLFENNLEKQIKYIPKAKRKNRADNVYVLSFYVLIWLFYKKLKEARKLLSI